LFVQSYLSISELVKKFGLHFSFSIMSLILVSDKAL